jgi:hypothetical protein
MMKKEDWDKLCRNIYEKKCILLLGSEFPLELVENKESTTFSKLLSAQLKEEIQSFDRAPQSLLKGLEDREVSQLACDYINYKGADKKLSREDLEAMLTDSIIEIENKVESQIFNRLASLPFSFIVNTNHTNFFCKQLTKLDKTPTTAYYNFRGDKVDLVETVTTDELGTELHPFIYNLFGSVDDASSLVISENDMVQFVINIISKNPGLPANVKSELAD